MDPRFEALLLEYAQADSADGRTTVEETLWKEFGHEKVVLVMDMSGFSLLTQRHGIVHYLSMVKRMQLTTQPIIEKHGGVVVKFEADNCFAAFDEVLPAVQAAVDLNQTFNEMNEFTDDTFDLRVSIGIDIGKVLMIGGPDYFGNAVNRASKLGEDIAEAGQILITDTAYHQGVAGAGLRGEPLELTISGITLNAIELKYDPEDHR